MRILIDTNVLISAALNANGVPFQAYAKATAYPNHGLICEQNVDEMKRIFNKNKDFLESGLENPMIMTPAEFLEL